LRGDAHRTIVHPAPGSSTVANSVGGVPDRPIPPNLLRIEMMSWFPYAALIAGVFPLLFMTIGYRFVVERRRRQEEARAREAHDGIRG